MYFLLVVVGSDQGERVAIRGKKLNGHGDKY
jgi:hypothetical protein